MFTEEKSLTRNPVASVWNKYLDALSWAVIFLFVASLGLGFLVPVYTDEVATKFMQARFFAEDGKLLSLFPQCPSGFVRDTPIAWYPAAVIYSLLYADLSPLGIRLSGVVLIVAALLIAIRCVCLVTPAYQARLRIVAALAAILSLGVLPLTLVLARSEQWLILLLICYLLFALLAIQRMQLQKKWQSAGLLGIFILITSLLSFSHPKALFFLFFVLVSAFLIFKKRGNIFLGVAIAFTIFSAFQSYEFTKSAIRCDDAPVLSKILASQATQPSLLVTSPIPFLGETTRNLMAAPRKISEHLLFQTDYQSGWLPSSQQTALDDKVNTVNKGIRLVLQAVIWFGVLLPPLVLFLTRKQRLVSAGQLLLAALWVGLVGHLLLFREWNFYGGALILPLVCLLVTASSLFLYGDLKQPRIAAWLLVPLFILSLSSFAILASRLAPQLMEQTRLSSEALWGQPLSVNAFSFSKARNRIRALAEDCGLQGDGAQRLVVDDLTYFAFTDFHQPLHANYLYAGGFGADIGSGVREFLNKMGSDGVVSQCTYLAPSLLVVAMRDGNLCCINLQNEKSSSSREARSASTSQK